MKSKYTSQELFHLVGRAHPRDHEANYQILLKVLADSCVSHPPHSPDWGKVSYTIRLERSLISGDLLDPTVTCFCDIPLSDLGLHAAKYGLFGLSFRRDWLVEVGARPVTYVPLSKAHRDSIYGPALLADLDAVYRGLLQQSAESSKPDSSVSRSLRAQPTTPDGAIVALRSVFERDILAFIKPFNADLADSDVANFYLEREWRKYGNLPFDVARVERVLVAPGFMDRLARDAPAYTRKAFALNVLDAAAKCPTPRT